MASRIRARRAPRIVRSAEVHSQADNWRTQATARAHPVGGARCTATEDTKPWLTISQCSESRLLALKVKSDTDKLRVYAYSVAAK
jgi:hypothetical protein